MSFLLVAALGCLAGAAVNWLADVLPVHRRLVRPRCPACHGPRPPSSWLGLLDAFGGGRCRYCGRRRGLRPPLTELVSAGFAVWLYARQPHPPPFLAGWLVGIVFLLIAVIDIEHRLILRLVVIPAALVLGVLGALQPGRGPVKVLLGGVAGFLLLWLMYLLGLAFSRWMARRRRAALDEVAFGFGDVLLGGLIGLVVGWPGVIIAVVTGVILAGVFSLGYLAYMSLRRRYSAFTAIPYGPFLLLGACLVYYGGRTALEALMS
ncbi:MAG TPA: prepilin peptidase [Anaerolineales bacterium]|nr:prepilin peptidase [Anaerolineales bacterium]